MSCCNYICNKLVLDNWTFWLLTRVVNFQTGPWNLLDYNWSLGYRDSSWGGGWLWKVAFVALYHFEVPPLSNPPRLPHKFPRLFQPKVGNATPAPSPPPAASAIEKGISGSQWAWLCRTSQYPDLKYERYSRLIRWMQGNLVLNNWLSERWIFHLLDKQPIFQLLDATWSTIAE